MANFITIICAFVLVICVQCGPIEHGEETDSLVLVHVLFRHGNRTPDKASVYPKDPYKNETYYPVGYGQLTNQGKRTEYDLGKTLKRYYQNFLGRIYTPEILDARTTDSNRTKMSLQLVLAGLFPPALSQMWSELYWQPIPYNYWRIDEDEILRCYDGRNYNKRYSDYQNSPKEQSELQKYRKVFQYISDNTGLNVQYTEDLFELYFCLTTEEEWGFKLPEWTKKVWPKTITELAIRNYQVQTATTGLRRLTAGFLLKKILEDTKAKLNGTLIPQERKIFLYSAHEMNVSHLLILLDLFYPHIPPYGAYVVLEVHNINGTHRIRILYQDYKQQNPKLLKLKSCDVFCPIDDFISLFEEYFPVDEKC